MKDDNFTFLAQLHIFDSSSSSKFDMVLCGRGGWGVSGTMSLYLYCATLANFFLLIHSMISRYKLEEARALYLVDSALNFPTFDVFWVVLFPIWDNVVLDATNDRNLLHFALARELEIEFEALKMQVMGKA